MSKNIGKNNISILNFLLSSFIFKLNFYIVGCFVIKYDFKNFDFKDLKIKINNLEYNIFYLLGSFKYSNLLPFNIKIYILKIPVEKLLKSSINNRMIFSYNKNGINIEKNMKYSIFRNKRGFFNKRINNIRKLQTSIYIKQSEKNNCIITVRKTNKTDSMMEQLKINTAYYFSKFMKKNLILIYEKKSLRYEESGSVLFEKLIDNGYDNVYYILDRNSKDINEIDKKYIKKVIYKNTFKHYFYFFIANTYMGTELLGHAIDLRIANKYAMRRINDEKLNFIFLQHGITYMIPLTAKTRVAFRRIGRQGIRKIVVSSTLEAQHFIECGNYNYQDMYLCGLPKFDKNEWNKDADKIIIMPTWRPWEYNQARLDFAQTKYYKMVSRIFESIPDKYKDKLIILPHPLIAEMITEFDDDMKKYMNFKDKYDDLLKQAKVLITDYSSISYDAFYRGSNVIFYWEEKDYCMEQYGEGTKLMLNEENCFGDICYKPDQLSEVIEKNYLQDQNKKYIDNYRKIVEFNDNKNTERLISYLKKDKLI